MNTRSATRMQKSNTSSDSSDSSDANSIQSIPTSQTDINSSIYCYPTRNKFNASNSFEKQLGDMLEQSNTIEGRQTKIRHINNIYDLIRRNKKHIFAAAPRYDELLVAIRNKTLQMYHKEKLYRLANEWHFWIFDTYIAV
jgi:hypothetical protein